MASKLLIRTGNSLINRLRSNSTHQNNRICNPQTLSHGHGAEVTTMLFPPVSKHQTAHHLQQNDTESLKKLESEGIFFPFGLPSLRFFLPDAPVRPPSPASDGSFYYQNNIPAVPHMHGMPYGVGIGPSFPGHQPVVFNPMIAPMQSQHAYVQPNGPQYAQPMLLGHPRHAMYMPGYQPEMPYKGREY